jgi:hypothetical protein
MNKSKIAGSQKCKAYFGIRVDIALVVEGVLTPYQIGPIEEGVG